MTKSGYQIDLFMPRYFSRHLSWILEYDQIVETDAISELFYFTDTRQHKTTRPEPENKMNEYNFYYSTLKTKDRGQQNMFLSNFR